MRLRVLAFWCVLVLGGSLLGLAQQPTGPATLENLLTDAPAVASPLPGGRIQGAVTRPKDGVKHPDLDAAWAEYDAQIEAVAKSVEYSIERALNAAAADGDLDAALKWKTAGEKFQKDRKIPEELDRRKTDGRRKPEPQEPERSPQSQIAEAQKRLAAAYEAVEKSLVKSHDLEQAKRVRSEREASALGKDKPLAPKEDDELCQLAVVPSIAVTVERLAPGVKRLSGHYTPEFETVSDKLRGAEFLRVEWQRAPTYDITVTKPGLLYLVYPDDKQFVISNQKSKWESADPELTGPYLNFRRRMHVEAGDSFQCSGLEVTLVAGKIVLKKK